MKKGQIIPRLNFYNKPEEIPPGGERLWHENQPGGPEGDPFYNEAFDLITQHEFSEKDAFELLLPNHHDPYMYSTVEKKAKLWKYFKRAMKRRYKEGP